jgi:hypothetical protein
VAAGSGGRRGEILDLRAVAVARDMGHASGLRKEGATAAAGAAGVVGDGHVVAAAGHGGVAAAHDAGLRRAGGQGEGEEGGESGACHGRVS